MPPGSDLSECRSDAYGVLPRSDLSENRIKEVPAAIGKLSSLTRLDLHTNLMETLPPEIGKLDKVKHL